MSHKLLQSVGLALSVLYAALIVWIYATAPRTFREVATNTQVAAGTYEIDKAKFDAALALFRREQFRAARDEWEQADPAHSDARTQFYIAYAFYREGWGRVYNDDALFKQGLGAVTRSINLAQGGTLKVEDADLQMHTTAELKAELEQGTERTIGDFNPLKVLRTRK
jgi:hypothetical protein